MPKFTVGLHTMIAHHADVEVEAATIDEAVSIARKRANAGEITFVESDAYPEKIETGEVLDEDGHVVRHG